MNKRDKLGLGQKIENLCLETLALAIEAAYLPTAEKQQPLKTNRIKIEILKHLVRLAKDIKALEDRHYISLEAQLIEISKMNTNWLNWTITKESPDQTGLS